MWAAGTTIGVIAAGFIAYYWPAIKSWLNDDVEESDREA